MPLQIIIAGGPLDIGQAPCFPLPFPVLKPFPGRQNPLELLQKCFQMILQYSIKNDQIAVQIVEDLVFYRLLPKKSQAAPANASQ